MLIAGIDIAPETVALLAAMLRVEYYVKAAETLENALASGLTEVRLTIRERTAVLDVLDDAPDGLSELHGTLLAEHRWRRRIGLMPGRVM
jgi:hypothetical protein